MEASGMARESVGAAGMLGTAAGTGGTAGVIGGKGTGSGVTTGGGVGRLMGADIGAVEWAGTMRSGEAGGVGEGFRPLAMTAGGAAGWGSAGISSVGRRGVYQASAPERGDGASGAAPPALPNIEGIFVGMAGGRWSSRRDGLIWRTMISSGSATVESAGAASGWRKTSGVAAQSCA